MHRHETVDALVGAITRRRLTDGTTEVEQISRSRDGGALPGSRYNGRLRVQRGGSGPPSARVLQQVQDATLHAVVTELIVIGEHSYVRLDQQTRHEPRRPWIRLDPAAADGLSAFYRPQIASLRRDHPIDLVLAGTAGLVDATPEPVDSVPATRYTLRVEIDGSGEDLATAEQFRSRGVAVVETIIYVDADDRLLRLSTAADFGEGGALLVRTRMLSQGEPFTISAPPADQVVTLPQAAGATPSAAPAPVP